jgi:hypothetical protein
MVVRVNPNTAIALAVSFVQPVFAASWIDVQIDAEVTFPDRLVVEVINPLDAVAKTVFKPRADVIAPPSDQLVFDFEKGPSDSFTMEDDVDIDYWLEKLLADTQGFVDLAAKSFAKSGLVDSATVPDATALATDKPFADTLATPTDSVAKGFEKVLADSFSFTDLAVAVRLYIRDFAETLSPIDEYVPDIQPAKADAATTTDVSTLATGLGKAETLHMVDNMDGDLTYAFVKSTSDLAFASDTQVVDISTQKADNVLADDAGLLVMQDYSDITYFADDYVGTARNFT